MFDKFHKLQDQVLQFIPLNLVVVDDQRDKFDQSCAGSGLALQGPLQTIVERLLLTTKQQIAAN